MKASPEDTGDDESNEEGRRESHFIRFEIFPEQRTNIHDEIKVHQSERTLLKKYRRIESVFFHYL